MNKYYNFEIYTIDPVSGTTGWEIEFVYVKADSREEAKDRLKLYPNFDCIILFNHSLDMLDESDFIVMYDDPKYTIVKHIDIN